MDRSEWVVWSETRGTVEHALITDVRPGKYGPGGYLAGPLHDKMGAFDVGDLMRNGYVSMRGYRVMSPDYWAENETRLRREFERYDSPKARAKSAKAGQIFGAKKNDAVEWRALLGLSRTGALTGEQILSAFRMAAQRAHPDKGGEAGAFERAVLARDGLLGLFGK
jgi:hypothetical protein